jgi:hypothetical protein
MPEWKNKTFCDKIKTITFYKMEEEGSDEILHLSGQQMQESAWDLGMRARWKTS